MAYATEIEVTGTDKYGFLSATNETLETNPTAIIDNEFANCILAVGNVYDMILIATTNGLTIFKKQDVHKSYCDESSSRTTLVPAAVALLTGTQISCVRFSPAEKYLAVGTKDDLRIYSSSEVHLALSSNSNVQPLCIFIGLPNVQYLEWNNTTESENVFSFIAIDEGHTFHYCDFDAQQNDVSVHRSYNNIAAASWRPDGSCVAIGTMNGDVYLVRKADLHKEALSSPVSLPTLLEHPVATCSWFEDNSIFVSSLIDGQIITYILIVNTTPESSTEIELVRILEYMAYQDVEPSGGGIFHLCYLPHWKILVPVYHNASSIDYILHYEEDTWKICDMEDPAFAAFIPSVEETPQGAVGAVVDLQYAQQKMDPVENKPLGKSPVITMLTSQSRLIGMCFAKRGSAVDYPGITPIPGSFSFGPSAFSFSGNTTSAASTTVAPPPSTLGFTPISFEDNSQGSGSMMFSFGSSAFGSAGGSSSSAFSFQAPSSFTQPTQQSSVFDFGAAPSIGQSKPRSGLQVVQKYNSKRKRRATPTHTSSEPLPKFDFEQPPLFIMRTPQNVWESNLASLYNHPKMYDFYFVLPGGEKLYCSRVILSSNSPVFKTMFESGFTESQNQFMEITEEMEHVQSFQMMIQFMYYKTLTITSAETLYFLLETADKYEMRDMEAQITNAITNGNEKFDISGSMVDLLTIANLTKNQKLHSHLLKQIVYQFDAYFLYPRINILLELSFPQVESLFLEIKLLGRRIESSKLLEFVLQWSKHDPSRSNDLSTLLKRIQWSTMDNFYLLSFLDRPEIKSNVDILQGIIRGFMEEKSGGGAQGLSPYTHNPFLPGSKSKRYDNLADISREEDDDSDSYVSCDCSDHSHEDYDGEGY